MDVAPDVVVAAESEQPVHRGGRAPHRGADRRAHRRNLDNTRPRRRDRLGAGREQRAPCRPDINVRLNAKRDQVWNCGTTGLIPVRTHQIWKLLRFAQANHAAREEPRPSRCPECAAGLGPNEVLVGIAHCRCGRLHRSHSCRHGQHTIYTPPLDDSCAFQTLD